MFLGCFEVFADGGSKVKDLWPPGLLISAGQGVGDCEHSWSVDGQSAIRWHRGGSSQAES